MGVVGEKFKNNEIFVPEMLVAARAMKETVEALNKEDFRKDIKIMVGGAPITPEFAEEIGADAYTADAASAAQVAKSLAA